MSPTKNMLTFSNFTYADPLMPWYKRWFIKALEKCTGQYHLWKLYREYHREYEDSSEAFWHAAVRKLKLNLHYDEDRLNAIPRRGPLVIVANHPYGMLDGLVIGHLIHKVRQDYKVLTNSVLCQAEEVQDYVLPVDFSPTRAAWEMNLESRQKARALLKIGRCLVVFPAGGVSYIHSRRDKTAFDNSWQSFIGSLIHGQKANVVPVFFEGQNSRLFQLASLYSETLRLALFFREVARRIDTDMKIEIGRTLEYSDLEEIKNRDELCDFLYCQTYALGGISHPPTPRPAFRIDPPKKEKGAD